MTSGLSHNFFAGLLSLDVGVKKWQTLNDVSWIIWSTQAGAGVVVSLLVGVQGLLVGVQVGELFVGRPPLHVICRATNPLSRRFKVFSPFKCSACRWKLGCHVRQGMIFGRLRFCCQQNVIHCPLKCSGRSVLQQVRTPSGVDQWVVALFKCFKCLPHRQQLLQWNSTGALLNMLQNRCYFTIHGRKVLKYQKCEPAIPHVTPQNWSWKVWVCNSYTYQGVFISASPTQPLAHSWLLVCLLKRREEDLYRWEMRERYIFKSWREDTYHIIAWNYNVRLVEQHGHYWSSSCGSEGVLVSFLLFSSCFFLFLLSSRCCFPIQNQNYNIWNNSIEWGEATRAL